MKVFLNDRLVEAADARLDVSDRGFLLGDGLFETLAVRDGAPRRLDAHLARLAESAGVLGLELPWPAEILGDAVAETVSANGLGEGVIRLTVSRGPADRGLWPVDAGPTLLITATPTGFASTPVTAVVCTVTRRNELSPLSRVKSTNYLDAILARREAHERGAEDALILNTRGLIAETTIANVFAVMDGELITPPLADGPLPGIMRGAVLEAEQVAERSLRPDDLWRAEEAFLTNATGIRPLVRVEDRDVGDGAPGPVWERLQAVV